MTDLAGKRILLVVGGGIAAYKSLELVRRLRDRGASVRTILTSAGSQFVTPLSLASLSGDRVYQDLFSLTDEAEMGHIELSRAADLVVVAPATADLMAKMASGHANDLASTALLATDKQVLIAPAMNVRMWLHPATTRNLATLRADGVHIIGPDDGAMACGEFGPGRMVEPDAIVARIVAFFANGAVAHDTGGVLGGVLAGLSAIVTAGPTIEPIDPVRFIANRSSGKQGYAIARALANAGANTTLVSGPVAIAAPGGVRLVRVATARDMLAACEAALPADIAVCAAAVADWRADDLPNRKIRKRDSAGPPTLRLIENPDILKTLAQHPHQRPQLVIGFAAETDDLLANAAEKLRRKSCDWIIANDVGEGTDVMGGDDNLVHLLTAQSSEAWPKMSKDGVATRLVAHIARHFGRTAS